MPTLNADAWPPFDLRSTRTRGSNVRMISGVWSVEPSSTTIISTSAMDISCSSTLLMACAMNCSWLYVSIKTLTYGFDMVLQFPPTIPSGTAAAATRDNSVYIPGNSDIRPNLLKHVVRIHCNETISFQCRDFGHQFVEAEFGQC